MPPHSLVRVAKKPLRLDDEMQFIRTWIGKPLSTGAVMPSSKALARTMARYVNPAATGPVIELGPGTGPVTEAMVERGVDPARLILVEFNPDFCRLLRTRYPRACKRAASDAALKPLPSEETTPPVIKIYRAMGDKA